jgi:H-type small acid-soluble spore protein
MDSTRAKQILNGNSNINVTYQGTPVWIEAVSENNTAEVTQLSGNKSRMQVPVNMLEEKS